MSLATKYRPRNLDEILGADTVVKILKNVVKNRNFKHAYLFAGASGCGKTSCSRVFAKAINQGQGEPIEVDCASMNSVENVRAICAQASQRALDSEYKIYILDEAHALSGDSWKAFLKTIEETPEYTIFIFCTTDPEKIPTMILNRLQRYNFSTIDSETIKNRLLYVCRQEGFTNYEKTCDLISKTVHGCMRDALTKLEQCADFSKDLSLENAKQVLTGISYETMFKLTWALQDKDEGNILSIIDNLYNEGTDLKNFISLYLEFILDLSKYEIFKNINLTNIPAYLATEENPVVQQTVNFENSISWFNNLIDCLLNIKVEIKYDSSYLSTIKAFLLRFCR